MKNRVCEQMLRFEGDYLNFRVWVTANQNFETDTKELKSLIASFRSLESSNDNMKKIICEIEKLKNIAAIEILEKNGNGILLYPDWN